VRERVNPYTNDKLKQKSEQAARARAEDEAQEQAERVKEGEQAARARAEAEAQEQAKREAERVKEGEQAARAQEEAEEQEQAKGEGKSGLREVTKQSKATLAREVATPATADSPFDSVGEGSIVGVAAATKTALAGAIEAVPAAQETKLDGKVFEEGLVAQEGSAAGATTAVEQVIGTVTEVSDREVEGLGRAVARAPSNVAPKGKQAGTSIESEGIIQLLPGKENLIAVSVYVLYFVFQYCHLYIVLFVFESDRL